MASVAYSGPLNISRRLMACPGAPLDDGLDHGLQDHRGVEEHQLGAHGCARVLKTNQSSASDRPTDSPIEVTIMTIETTPGRRIVDGAVIGLPRGSAARPMR
jgi:hypothetical protein